MEKEFVPYEQAIDLKELGFDIPCIKYYWTDRTVNRTYEIPIDHNKKDVVISAPLYQQVFRWFREKYGLFYEIQIDRTTAPKFCFNIFQYEHFGNYEDIRIGEWYLYRTYEEAELECLKKLIEITRK